MISLLVCSVGLSVRNQPQQQAALAPEASPSPQPSPAAGPGIDWASGAPLPKAPTAPLAEPPTTAVAPVAAPVPATPTVDNRNMGGNMTCVSIQPGTSDYWCSTTCASGLCPETICKCGDDAGAQSDAKVADALANHQAEEAKIRDAAESMPTSASTTPEHDAAQEQVKDAMGATVAEIKDKVAGQEGAMAAAVAAVPEAATVPADVTPPQQQEAAAPSPDAAVGKKCVAIVQTATDQWCENTCKEAPSPVLAVTPTSYCPKEICKCG